MGENEGGNDMGRFRETRIETQAFLAISNLHHAESRTAGVWFRFPKPYQKPEVSGLPTLGK